MRKNKKRNHQKHPVPNHKYKDRLFRLVFNNKKDLLDLYNALNNTCYENPNDLEVNTLEDAVYLSMKNDISFLIGGDTTTLFFCQPDISYAAKIDRPLHRCSPAGPGKRLRP